MASQSLYQKADITLPSPQRWSSAYPLGEVSNVLYGGPWGLNCQVGIPKGHSSYRGSDGVHISNPCGLILHNVTGAHHCYGWLDWHFLITGVPEAHQGQLQVMDPFVGRPLLL